CQSAGIPARDRRSQPEELRVYRAWPVALRRHFSLLRGIVFAAGCRAVGAVYLFDWDGARRTPAHGCQRMQSNERQGWEDRQNETRTLRDGSCRLIPEGSHKSINPRLGLGLDSVAGEPRVGPIVLAELPEQQRHLGYQRGQRRDRDDESEPEAAREWNG